MTPAAIAEQQQSYTAKAAKVSRWQIVDRVLDELYAREKRVNASLLLEEARDPQHPLHKFFEWDDGVAAERWRLDQAYRMIQASKYVVLLNRATPPPEAIQSTEVRRFVSAFHGNELRLRRDVLAEQNSREAFIDRKLDVLRGWCRDAVDIAELAPLRGVILKGIKKFGGRST